MPTSLDNGLRSPKKFLRPSSLGGAAELRIPLGQRLAHMTPEKGRRIRERERSKSNGQKRHPAQ